MIRDTILLLLLLYIILYLLIINQFYPYTVVHNGNNDNPKYPAQLLTRETNIILEYKQESTATATSITVIDNNNLSNIFEWITKGQLPINNNTPDDGERLDIVYSWVNGNDPLHKRIKLSQLKKLFPNTILSLTVSAEAPYRDHRELLYSIRSIYQYANNIANNIYIISMDCIENCDTFNNNNNNPNRWQIPDWYNTAASINSNSNSNSNTIDHTISVSMIYHSDLFSVHNNIISLPTFNSFAIETQLPALAATVSKIYSNSNTALSRRFIYLNDDMFITNYLSMEHFYSKYYGLVFYIEPTLLVKSYSLDDNRFQSKPASNTNSGEWPALEYSNALLSGRFGNRERSYISHYAHIFDIELLTEIQSLWSTELQLSSNNQFRSINNNDIHTAFLFVHYVIEMSRESQLKSYLLYKLDQNHNGYWEYNERQDLIDLFTKSTTLNNGINYYYGDLNSRYTLKYDNTKLHSNSKYQWSSLDGYPVYNNSGGFINNIHYCQFTIKQCLPAEWLSDNGSIKVNIEFWTKNNIYCGDCLLSILITESSWIGLEALLPIANTDNDNTADNEYRLLALTEINRYQYVLAESTALFINIADTVVTYTEYELKLIEYNKSNNTIELPILQPGILDSIIINNNTLFLCINDDNNNIDLTRTEYQYFLAEMNKLFPNKTPAEL